MKALIFLFIVLITFSFILTIVFWVKQRKLLQKNLIHRSKYVPKFELIEVSPEDEKFNDYYEPKIIKVFSNDE